MPLIAPHFQGAFLDQVPQSGQASTSGSDLNCLHPTLPSGREHRRKFSHYELLESIGEGQFGTVWRAKDQRLNRIVALKLPHLADFDERRRSLFLREARAAAALEHPNIVRVHGVEQDGDQLGILSQFIEGQTLFQLLQDERPSFAESARILAIVADAVHHAHEAGVIHRDLKPSNILMDAEDQPHVSDFGLAKLSGDQSLLTNPGVVLGTPAYMSPEQARGDSHLVDRRSDVYSLGVLLYEMLTGKPPFEGNSTLLLHQIQSQDPRTPRTHDKSIPLDLETICLKCLAKAPVERYAQARELADDLQRFLAGEPIKARSIGFAERCVRWTRRNPAVAASVGVSVLSTLAAIGLGATLLIPSTSQASRALPASHSDSSPAVAPTPRQPIQVTLATEPEGATVVFYPLDESTGEPRVTQAIRPEKKSPVTQELLPGDYLVVAVLPDGRFHEVYRFVPYDVFAIPMYYPHRRWQVAGGVVSLAPVTIPQRETDPNMSLLEDRRSAKERMSSRTVNAFLLDQREVTIGEFVPKFNNELPPSLRLRPELMNSLEFPITGLFFDEAVTFAELSGKRLPTAMEYEFAATNGWTSRYPWGDAEPPSDAWRLTANHKLFDQTPGLSPIFGLFSNASEYVYISRRPPSDLALLSSPMLDRKLLIPIVRGGPVNPATDTSDLRKRGPQFQSETFRTVLSTQIGFRCAKSKSPRL